MKKITVIGSLNMDHVIQVPAMPRLGETVLASGFDLIPGGKGANQACAAGRLGAQVSMLGAVGRDEPGGILLDSLARAGVDLSHIKRCADVRTGAAFISVDAQGRNSIMVHPGANAQVDVPYIKENAGLLEASDIVLLQLEIPLETVVFAAKTAKSLGKTVILDPAPAQDGLPAELFSCVDYLKPNEVELTTLTGDPQAQDHLAQAAQAMRARGVGNVTVTLGGEGAFVLDSQGNARAYPAQKGLRVVDSTAAGDSFTGAMAVALAQGKSLGEAVEFAILVSGIVVTRKGAQTSIPTLAEVEAFRRDMRDM